MSHWPQLAYLACSILGLGFAMALHGQPREGSHNFVTTLISVSIGWWLLWAGGFFAGLFP